MPSATDVAFLDKALADLETARKWTPRTISKLEALINTDDPWATYRVDPLRFAAARGIAEQEAIDLFLHASQLGLFQIEWRLLCPVCGDTMTSCRNMTTVKSRCYCQLCQMEAEAVLDQCIAVSFNLSPRVRDLPWHHPDTLSAADLLLRYRIHSEASFNGIGKVVEVLGKFALLLDHLKPAEQRTFEAEIAPGWALVGYNIASGRTFVAPVEGAGNGQTQPVRAEFTGQGWTLSRETVAPGKLKVTIVNATANRAPFMTFARPDAGAPGTSLGVFLNGNRLLSNQTFRTLYRAEALAAGEGVGVRDLTLLFTDLKGSTELYERVGDMSAFALVQQHFEHLSKAVQEQEGAVVKTIGDAVMASFVHPQQAVRAALAMFREIETFNRTRGTRDLILKIGVHHGHSIAVTLNERLDYFGQTVNIAARVQGVANADEICLTEDVYEIPAVQEALKGLEAKPELAQLKGIQESVPIRRVRVKSA